MLSFDKTEEQVLIQQTINKIADDYYDAGKHAEYSELSNGFSPDVWQVVAESGLLGLSLTEDVGGYSRGNGDLAVLMESIGKAIFLEPFLSGPIVTGILLEYLGAPQQHEDYIPLISEGKVHFSLTHSEAASRYQLDYVTTTYTQNGEDYYITGQKVFGLGPTNADKYIVSAVPNAADNQSCDAIKFFIIDTNSQGIFSQNYKLTDGTTACKVEYSQAHAVPLQGGYKAFEKAVAKIKVAACAEIIGIMGRVFDDTLEYVKTREQFGRSIGKFQIIQHRLADQFTALELCRSHLLRMVACDVENASDRKQISGSKAFISKTAIDLAEEAVQLHGGMGITDELAIGRGLKRLLVLTTFFGDADHELKQFA